METRISSKGNKTTNYGCIVKKECDRCHLFYWHLVRVQNKFICRRCLSKDKNGYIIYCGHIKKQLEKKE